MAKAASRSARTTEQGLVIERRFSTPGVHPFDVTLRTAGSQTVTVTDAVTSTVTGSATLTVHSAAASWMYVWVPDPVVVGVPADVYVFVLDEFWNLVPSYTGTVAFASLIDPAATLPSAAPFATPHDGWAYSSGGVTFTTAGDIDLWAYDTSTYIYGLMYVSVAAA